MPKSSLTFEQGDIVVAALLFSEQVGAKRRPALVISRSGYNRSSDDIVVLKVTSRGSRTRYDVGLAQSDLADGALKAESQIMVDNPVTLYKGMVEGKVGRVTPQKLSEVKARMRELYAL